MFEIILLQSECFTEWHTNFAAFSHFYTHLNKKIYESIQ